MLNSRDVALLRHDVAANVRTLVRRCADEGLAVAITQTVRDDEYQAKLYAQGRTAPGRIVTGAKTTSFHGAGLAIDFCKNVKAGAYSDSQFFDRVIAIAKAMGFSSGRDWKSFPESCHLQWDGGGKYTAAMVRAGHTPPPMPEICEEDEEMNISGLSDQQVLELAARMQALLGKQKPDMASSTGRELQEAIDGGITDGAKPEAFCTRKQAAIMVKRAAQRRIV